MEPPLHCRFARRGCAHDDALFKPAYQRVNRARGTKILRCFPHCCPSHIPRSYCGATIELRVTGAKTVSETELLVFARFRQRDDARELRVGDRVAWAAIARGLQSSANTKAPWIPSRVREPADQNHSHHSHGRAFEVNPGRRWYYAWDSSKNSATRATKHVLEAFVFVRELGNPDTLRCVATVTSPSFTLVSFRRVSASETARIAEELQDHAAVRSPVRTRESLRPSLRVLIKDGPTEARPASSPLDHSPVAASRSVDPLDVLFHVAQQYPMSEATLLLPTWMTRSEPHHSCPSNRARQYAAPPLRSLRAVASHVVWWLRIDRETQAAWREHTRRGARVLLHVHTLRVCHDTWMRWLYSHVECFLATLEQPPLAELATALASCGSIPQSATDSHCFSWRCFVAQAREVFTGVARPRPVATDRFSTQSPWRCPLELVQVASLTEQQLLTSLHHTHAPPQAMPSLSVTVLFAFWQQLSHLHIDLNLSSSPNELTLVTPSSRQESSTLAMRLLLDNRHRVCNALPNGEATGRVGFAGDYIASQRRDGSLEIDLFAWPTASSPTRWRWTLRRESLAWDRLDVQLTVSMAELRGPHREDSVTWPIQEKLALVTGWRDTYRVLMPYSRYCA